jgi:hypothetical protein
MSTDNQREKGIVSRCMNSRRRFDCCLRGSVIGNKRKRVHCNLRCNTIDHDIFAIISRMSFHPTNLESETVYRTLRMPIKMSKRNERITPC